jgi:hypothetical protein
MSRDAAKLIICEPSPRWAVLMRRFAPGMLFSEARSLALAADMLRETPCRVIAVAVTPANAAELLLKLSQWQRDDPALTAAALLDHVEDDFELALRESGVQLVLTSLFELPKLARLAHRVKACPSALSL